MADCSWTSNTNFIIGGETWNITPLTNINKSIIRVLNSLVDFIDPNDIRLKVFMFYGDKTDCFCLERTASNNNLSVDRLFPLLSGIK